jgi:hypothetical protein
LGCPIRPNYRTCWEDGVFLTQSWSRKCIYCVESAYLGRSQCHRNRCPRRLAQRGRGRAVPFSGRTVGRHCDQYRTLDRSPSLAGWLTWSATLSHTRRSTDNSQRRKSKPPAPRRWRAAAARAIVALMLTGRRCRSDRRYPRDRTSFGRASEVLKIMHETLIFVGPKVISLISQRNVNYY